MSYKAVVSRIYTQPLPNSDSLFIGEILGYKVIVGPDTPSGSLGVFFPVEGVLSEEFCTHNKLTRKLGGFFEDNRRVRAIKLRGSKSEGFFCNLSSFNYCGVPPYYFSEGMVFDEVNGHKICEKYVTPETEKILRSKNASVKLRKGILMFPKHAETEQFKRDMYKILPGDILEISNKIHGTSFRYGLVLVKQPDWVDIINTKINSSIRIVSNTSIILKKKVLRKFKKIFKKDVDV